MVSIGSLTHHRVSFTQYIHSLQVSVAMLYYSIVMISIALIAQGLLHSLPSLQVSVAMLYYSIVMVSIGS